MFSTPLFVVNGTRWRMRRGGSFCFLEGGFQGRSCKSTSKVLPSGLGADDAFLYRGNARFDVSLRGIGDPAVLRHHWRTIAWSGSSWTSFYPVSFGCLFWFWFGAAWLPRLVLVFLVLGRGGAVRGSAVACALWSCAERWRARRALRGAESQAAVDSFYRFQPQIAARRRDSAAQRASRRALSTASAAAGYAGKRMRALVVNGGKGSGHRVFGRPLLASAHRSGFHRSSRTGPVHNGTALADFRESARARRG